MTIAGGTWWFTAAEIAELRLPGVPRDKRSVNLVAAAEGWADLHAPDGSPLSRRRSARGGGIEYHASVLPAQAQDVLSARMEIVVTAQAAPIDAEAAAAERWAWFDEQTTETKKRAERRLTILQEIERLVATGTGKTAATQAIARKHGVAASPIADWWKAVADVPPAHRLPFLAPQYKGGRAKAEIADDLWQALLSDFLRLSGPSWATCYRRTETIAKARGLTLPAEKTLWRRFEKEVSRDVMTLHREGPDALRQNLPPQKRTVADLHALELVNIDGHRCNVRVQLADGRVIRPMMIAIQDVYSRKFLAWRFALNEDTVTARLTFADLFQKYGIPKGLLADNGRAFASKWLSGGAPTRFRFKVKPEDPVGLLKMLDIEIHWALPFRGSSKPIERGFRDFCDAIAKHPAFEGAYTGSNALDKPDNYGERAVSWETFEAIWNAGIHAHNAQLKRRTETGQGKFSFDQVFDASYAAAPIGKATPQQLRLALFAAEQVRADRKTGAVKILGNSYWTPALGQVAGDLVTVRFDPENAHSPVHVYDQRGRFIVTADLWKADGFLDAEAAKRRAKLEADHKKATKIAAQKLNLLEADQLAAMLPAYEDEAPPPEPSVVRPVRPRGVVAAALKPIQQDAPAPAQPDLVDRFTAGFARLRVVE